LWLQKRGNVIKVDRHKYVKVAYHGFRCLSSEERNAAYNHSAVSGYKLMNKQQLLPPAKTAQVAALVGCMPCLSLSDTAAHWHESKQSNPIRMPGCCRGLLLASRPHVMHSAHKTCLSSEERNAAYNHSAVSTFEVYRQLLLCWC
jgi:hydroxyacyl-ACP dehydratase HTD2-like protein with hotdog domain